MLTPDDSTSEGGHTDLSRARAGRDNAPLRDFLASCTSSGRRNVRELDRLYSEVYRGRWALFNDTRPFREADRFQYFHDLPTAPLQEAVVVLDPDNGLETRTGRGDKHLRYDETRHVYDIMGDSSVLLVFQFIPRVRRPPYLAMLSRRLSERVAGGRDVPWVSDNQVAFLALSRRDARGLLEEYAERYGLLFG